MCGGDDGGGDDCDSGDGGDLGGGGDGGEGGWTFSPCLSPNKGWTIETVLKHP